jgi:hypothetical protein
MTSLSRSYTARPAAVPFSFTMTGLPVENEEGLLKHALAILASPMPYYSRVPATEYARRRPEAVPGWKNGKLGVGTEWVVRPGTPLSPLLD